MKWCTLVLLVAGATWADNALTYGETPSKSPSKCSDLKSQESLDFDKIMGKWYVVEILEHKIEPTKPMNGARVVIDTCPIVKLSPTEFSLLRLLWTEDSGDIEYTFRVPDSHGRPGLWISTALQNGTLTEKRYNQFSGSVHVMKAVASHMVLTFCSRNPESQLYSVLLSREHVLEKSNLRGVHNLLSRRSLNIAGIRETCANGEGRVDGASRLVWAVLVLLASTSLPF
ncbi:uncharacterized protein LOC105695630 [Orussus abietinus]|uniref:uncharacterized protein LOC105695630 n=1 Tax=Orussus abietinus TaxID=222816 RepID=UPI0006256300|nr:uncharacterized protein LOC105695630 [Orussus abietinus]